MGSEMCIRDRDQFGSAARVAKIGAGITLTPLTVSASSIRRAVKNILSDVSYSNIAQTFQKRQNDSDSLQKIVDIIETVVHAQESVVDV